MLLAARLGKARGGGGTRPGPPRGDEKNQCTVRGDGSASKR
jgi:hypothetical protein